MTSHGRLVTANLPTATADNRLNITANFGLAAGTEPRVAIGAPVLYLATAAWELGMADEETVHQAILQLPPWADDRLGLRPLTEGGKVPREVWAFAPRSARAGRDRFSQAPSALPHPLCAIVTSR